MKIEILYFEGCPNHEPTVQRVRQIVDVLSVEATVTLRQVEASDDLAALGFCGSPTVLVNGQDIDPAQRDGATYGFGCRTFDGQGVPGDAMIEAAVREAAG